MADRRPRSAGLAFAALLLGLAAPAPAAAEDLLDAWRQARDRDPVLAQAEANRLAVRENVAIARAPLLPQLSAGLGFSEQRRGGAAAVGLPAVTRSREPQLTLTQTVLDLGRLAALDVSRAEADAQDASYRAALQALPVRVAVGYVGVLVAAENLSLLQANEDAFAQQVKEADARYQAGLSALVDLDQAKAYLGAARAETLAAQQALDAAREALAEITGTPAGSAPVPLKTLREDAPATPPQPADPQAWVTLALARNPLIAAQQASVTAAERSIARAKAGYAPTLVAGIGSGRPAAWPDDGSGRDGHGVTTVSLTLNLPLVDGGATSAAVRQATFLRNAADQALEAQRRRVARDVLDQYRRVVSGIAQIEASRQAVASASKALESTRVGQQTGTHTMTDLLLAIQLLGIVQSTYSQARHQFVLDRLLLAQSAGSVDEQDLVALNAQLQ